MSNKGLMIAILLVLVGIFAIMIMNYNEETPAEQISNSISETVEEVGDEIDDATVRSPQ